MSGIGDFTPNGSTAAPIAELAKALVAVQKTIKNAVQSSYNTYFKAKYANLADIWEVARQPLTDNGLSVIQLPGWDSQGGRVTLQTILLHTSGQSISNTMSLRPKEDNPPSVGLAITYARRYALAALLGIVQEDDDGQEASRPENEQQPPKKTTTPPVEHKPAAPANDTRPGIPSSINRTATGVTQPGPTVNVPRANIPDALENETGLPGTEPQADQPPAGLPTAVERKDFVGRMKIYSRSLLPKVGIPNGSDALKAFIVKTTGQEDVKLLTKTQWETILDLLDKAQTAGTLKELVS